MKIRWDIATTTSGKRIVYLYKDSWGKRYYSFDNEKSWHESKVAAYIQAISTDSLAYARDMKDKHFADNEGGIN
jgi:hypothetical protein